MKTLRFPLLILFVVLSACQTSDSQVAINAPKTCEQINSTKVLKQVGFQSIFPGKTTTTEISKLLGKPNVISSYSNIEDWVYPEFKLTVSSGIVNSLTIDRASKEMLKLGDLIEEYGCPDDIYAFAPYEDVLLQDDTYSVAVLMYLSIGLEIYTSFPIRLDDLPTAVTYISPTSLEQLISDIRFPKTQIAWDELIQPISEIN